MTRTAQRNNINAVNVPLTAHVYKTKMLLDAARQTKQIQTCNACNEPNQKKR